MSDSTESEFRMNPPDLLAASGRVDGLAGLSSDAISSLPSAAAAAAGPNATYATAHALVNLCGTQLVQAVGRVSGELRTQSSMLKVTAEQAEQADQEQRELIVRRLTGDLPGYHGGAVA